MTYFMDGKSIKRLNLGQKKAPEYIPGPFGLQNLCSILIE